MYKKSKILIIYNDILKYAIYFSTIAYIFQFAV